MRHLARRATSSEQTSSRAAAVPGGSRLVAALDQVAEALSGHTASSAPSAPSASSGSSAALASSAGADGSPELGGRGGLEPAALAVVARVTAEALDGACLLFLVDESGDRFTLSAASDVDPARRAVLEKVATVWQGALEPGAGEQSYSGPPWSVPDPLLAEVAAGDAHLLRSARWAALAPWFAGDPLNEVLAAHYAEANLLLAPLRSADPAGGPGAGAGAGPTALGLLAVVRLGPTSELSLLDRVLLQHLADRVAHAVDHDRLAFEAERARGEARREAAARRVASAPRPAEIAVSAVSDCGGALLLATDGEGVVTLAEGRLGPLVTGSAGTLVGRHLLDLVAGHPALEAELSHVLGGEELGGVRVTVDRSTLELWTHPGRRLDGSPGQASVLLLDVTAELEASRRAGDAELLREASLRNVSDMVLVLGEQGTIVSANPAASRLLGYDFAATDVTELTSLAHPDDREVVRQAIADSFAAVSDQPTLFRLRHADSRYLLVEALGARVASSEADRGALAVALRDVTGVAGEGGGSELTAASAARQAALADLGRWALVGLEYVDLVSDAADLLAAQLSVDSVHVFEALPDAEFMTLIAHRGGAVVGNELLSAEPTSSPASFALVSQETVVSEDLALEERFDVPDLWSRTSAISVVEVPIPGQESPVGVIGVGRTRPSRFSAEDVHFVKAVANVLASAAARQRAERAIRAQALQDPLTGLPNRLVLAEHSALSAAPPGKTARLSGEERTVFVFDIDRFKEINDTLGHSIGDLVLLEVARRLRSLGDPVEMVARLGGDEFAIIAKGVADHDAELNLAHQILAGLGEPLDVGGVNMRLRGSIGVASADVDREGEPLQVSALLRRAEVAMFQAKSEHRGVRRYTDDLERTSLSRLALASELAEAIERGQLVLDYQPKVRARTGKLTGVEALVRWHHPTRGLLSPDVFVPLAEQTGIIRELTDWVLGRALAECASWQRAGWVVPVAVNLSAGTLHDPSLLDALLTATSRFGLSTGAIEVEVTESAVMRDPDGAMRSLATLTQRGVHVALDDFGTGYSSLAYLQRLSVKSVKIDKSFVKPLVDDEVARAIVRAIVQLGHSLHLTVIAEGVDSVQVLDVLRQLDCDAVQGYLIAKPMGPQDLQRWITARAARPEPSPSPPPSPEAGQER